MDKHNTQTHSIGSGARRHLFILGSVLLALVFFFGALKPARRHPPRWLPTGIWMKAAPHSRRQAVAYRLPVLPAQRPFPASLGRHSRLPA
jgi:hypothetical protein